MKVSVRLSELENGFEAPEEWTGCFDRVTGNVVVIDDGTMRAAEDAEEEALTGAAALERAWDVIPEAFPQAREIARDLKEERFLRLPTTRDFHEYRRMEEFIDSMPAGEAQERLGQAISGKGVFRRFKDEAMRIGVIDGWYKFRDETLRQFLRDWAADHNLTLDETSPVRL